LVFNPRSSLIIPLAHAAEDIAVASSRQLTLSAIVLIAITLGVMMGFAFWSWRRRHGLSLRRRAAELALRASEDRLRQVSSQLPVALFEYVTEPEPAFRSISNGVARLLPGTATEMLADATLFFSGIHPDDVGRLVWRHAATLPIHDFEWVGRSLLPGEHPRWLQIRATTELTTEGQPAIHGVILDVTALKQAQQDLERSREELRRLASHREARVEQERARLAREVHDELGQVLTAARMQLQLLRSELATHEAAWPRLDDTEALIAEAYRSVKSIATDLRPAVLNLGLTAAVEWLVDRLLKPAGIRSEIRFSEDADTLTEEQSIALFRIIQESLANIVRHAGASKVTLEFSRDASKTRLVIQDDGHGFDPGRVDRQDHFGLLGMMERAEALGGTLRVDSQIGTGTCLTVEIIQ
jgi:signal transduction histidine kinase